MDNKLIKEIYKVFSKIHNELAEDWSLEVSAILTLAYFVASSKLTDSPQTKPVIQMNSTAGGVGRDATRHIERDKTADTNSPDGSVHQQEKLEPSGEDVCKVVGCNNRVMNNIKKSACAKNMKNVYGYCQIHRIEGLVKEISGDKKGCGKYIEGTKRPKLACGDFNGRVLCDNCNNSPEEEGEK